MSSINTKVINHKIGLLSLAEQLGNISKACKLFGVSQDTFYHYQKAKENVGVEAFFDKSRINPNIKNKVEDIVEQAVINMIAEQPDFGQVRVSNELPKEGLFISSSGVGSV